MKPSSLNKIKSDQSKWTLQYTVFFFIHILSASVATAEWKVDWSRRMTSSNSVPTETASRLPQPASPDAAMTEIPLVAMDSSSFNRNESKSALKPTSLDFVSPNTGHSESSFLDRVFSVSAPLQDVIVLHTEKGFVPNVIRVRKDGRYRIHVVNVNPKEKNVSFILDGFAENHATPFGQPKTFIVEPKREGTYSFMSPETAIEGRLLVIGDSAPQAIPAAAAVSPDSSRLPAQASVGVPALGPKTEVSQP